jgi:hypothetical protein
LKIHEYLFLQNHRAKFIQLDPNHPCIKEIQIVQIKGQILFKEEIITGISNYFQEPLGQKAEIYMKAS